MTFCCKHCSEKLPKHFLNIIVYLQLWFVCSFLQATFLLLCAVLYGCGWREYLSFLVFSLAFAWINVLYYSRGYKQLGMYSVMMQRVRFRDLSLRNVCPVRNGHYLLAPELMVSFIVHKTQRCVSERGKKKTPCRSSGVRRLQSLQTPFKDPY